MVHARTSPGGAPEWLAGLLVGLLPDEPEPLGLLALIRLHLARWPARLDADGYLVILEHRTDRCGTGG